MKCCANCIGDRRLGKEILPTLQGVGNGDCSYCLSQNVLVVDPPNLSDVFESLINIYTPNDQGKLLVQWLRDDWELFQHERMDDVRANALLCEILGDGSLCQKLVVPVSGDETDSLTKWEELRDELMFHNRFFPEVEFNTDHLENLLSYLILGKEDLPKEWHRARLMDQEEPFIHGVTSDCA